MMGERLRGWLGLALLLPLVATVAMAGEAKKVFVPIATGFAVQGEHITPDQAKRQAIIAAKQRAREIACGVEVVSQETLVGSDNTELYSEYIQAQSRGVLVSDNVLRVRPGTSDGLRGFYADLQATVRLKQPTKVPYSLDFKTVNSDGAESRQFSEGSNLFLKFRATRPVHVSVFAINGDGTIDRLVPYEGVTGHLETPNTWKTIPDPSSEETWPVYLPPGSPSEDIILFALATETQYDPPIWPKGAHRPSHDGGLEAFTSWYMAKIPEDQWCIVNRSLRITKP